jgi:hypothetical protein
VIGVTGYIVSFIVNNSLRKKLAVKFFSKYSKSAAH